jgi:hypothetical protein
MALDSSIPLQVRPAQIESPVNALAQVLQVQGAQQQAELGRMKLAEMQRGVERQNRLTSVLGGSYAKPEDLESALTKGGFLDEAMKYGKDRRENIKTEAEARTKRLEAAHKAIDIAGQAFGYVRQNPTPENAERTLQFLEANGIYDAAQVQQMREMVAANPQNIAALADQAFRAALSAKDQLPKFETRNTGGSTDTLQIDPVTGKVGVAASVRNTISPDAALSAQTQRRGQDLTDARARDANDAQKLAARTQVVETPEGVMLVDKGTGLARPAAQMSGKPLAGKPSATTEKELVGLRQQNSIVDGALAAVEKTPDAFSFGRGTATMAGAIPESIAGRFDSDEQRQARSYVFNNVSKVINERAGAAQSAQELARLRSFLPAETDNADQIKSKLKAFKTYLSDMETGTRGGKAAPAAGGGWGIQRVN